MAFLTSIDQPFRWLVGKNLFSQLLDLIETLSFWEDIKIIVLPSTVCSPPPHSTYPMGVSYKPTNISKTTTNRQNGTWDQALLMNYWWTQARYYWNWYHWYWCARRTSTTDARAWAANLRTSTNDDFRQGTTRTGIASTDDAHKTNTKDRYCWWPRMGTARFHLCLQFFFICIGVYQPHFDYKFQSPLSCTAACQQCTFNAELNLPNTFFKTLMLLLKWPVWNFSSMILWNRSLTFVCFVEYEDS